MALHADPGNAPRSTRDRRADGAVQHDPAVATLNNAARAIAATETVSDALGRVRLRSFKLRFFDHHAWIVPAIDNDGCAFAGPGVTLRGDEAARAFALANPLIEALSRFEPGIKVRALSIDLERPRVLASLEPTTPSRDPRPRVVRADAGALFDEILRDAGPLITYLEEQAGSALRRRLSDLG